MSDIPQIVMPPHYGLGEVDYGDGSTSISKSRSVNGSGPPPLGPLEHFKGDWFGVGFNNIFRPNNRTNVSTKFNPPLDPAFPNNNVLELNLTEETMTFSVPLGSTPNRGFDAQEDIFLNGVSYLQNVIDVTNPYNGKADGPKTFIHTEPGLWMFVPPTSNPQLGNTLSRMASIPHGTTINAQGSPLATQPGPPAISPIDIRPFPIGNPKQRLKDFPSLDVTKNNTSRLPQDLSLFVKTGTITQDILNNPHVVLHNILDKQKCLEQITFKISTTPLPVAPPLIPQDIEGGGVANIAFLQGKDDNRPNAKAVDVSAIFWIETIQYEIVVPPTKNNQIPFLLKPEPSSQWEIVPTFEVLPPDELKEPKTIVVTSTQIQYSQTVLLNFGSLSWPHVSVATLVPRTPVKVPSSAFD